MGFNVLTSLRQIEFLHLSIKGAPGYLKCLRSFGNIFTAIQQSRWRSLFPVRSNSTRNFAQSGEEIVLHIDQAGFLTFPG
jgi:hypothetical protein